LLVVIPLLSRQPGCCHCTSMFYTTTSTTHQELQPSVSWDLELIVVSPSLLTPKAPSPQLPVPVSPVLLSKPLSAIRPTAPQPSAPFESVCFPPINQAEFHSHFMQPNPSQGFTALAGPMPPFASFNKLQSPLKNS